VHRSTAQPLTLVVTGLLAIAGALGCTRPNPLDCGDGTCTDPAYPFCDLDGALRGHPETCIAVSCVPGDFVSCRGDQMLRCNGTGNDYEVTQCEHGCDTASAGCVSCVDSSQCANPAPTCDAAEHSCRACRTDDDCASEVCDTKTGSCIAAATIIYASPDGSPGGDCGAQTTPSRVRLRSSMRCTIPSSSGPEAIPLSHR
jgi:hypothetical protein